MSNIIVKGVVEKFSKIEVGTKNDEASTSFAYVDVHLLDNQYPNRFFFTSAEEAKEKLIDKVPIGSTVEFKIFKTDKFWNVDKKSFKILYEGDGTVPKSQKRASDYDNKVIRQNALRHADEWIKIPGVQSHAGIQEKLEQEYFRFAKECEKWVMGERN